MIRMKVPKYSDPYSPVVVRRHRTAGLKPRVRAAISLLPVVATSGLQVANSLVGGGLYTPCTALANGVENVRHYRTNAGVLPRNG
jgi:hypothetical protein